jgi:hypothetical protein
MTWLEPILFPRLGILGRRLDVTILSFGPTGRSDGPLDDTTINAFCTSIDSVFVGAALLDGSNQTRRN